MTSSHFDIIGMGNAIVDILSFVDEYFLASHQLTKSSMQLSSQESQTEILRELDSFTQMSGGSAANTIASIAGMNLNAGFIGCVAHDSWGEFYFNDLVTLGVTPLLGDVEGITGTSVILITPDSERTMHTHLGAASHVSPHSWDKELSHAKLLYIEGYAYDTRDQKNAANKAVEIVHSCGNKVAISLSDAACVDRHHSDFIELTKHADIAIGNEAEFCRLFDIAEQEITNEILIANKHLCSDITVVTQSSRGCTVTDGETIFSVPAQAPEKLVDLTGAGDQFAAGFLSGILSHRTLRESAQWGVELATRVIAHVGSRIVISDLTQIASKYS